MEMKIADRNGWICVSLSGQMNWEASTFFPMMDRFLGQIREAFDEKERPVVFDLSGLVIVDSSLVSLVIQTCRLAVDQRNAVISPSEQVRDIFYMLGLVKFVDVYDSEEEWLAARG